MARLQADCLPGLHRRRTGVSCLCPWTPLQQANLPRNCSFCAQTLLTAFLDVHLTATLLELPWQQYGASGGRSATAGVARAVSCCVRLQCSGAMDIFGLRCAHLVDSDR